MATTQGAPPSNVSSNSMYAVKAVKAMKADAIRNRSARRILHFRGGTPSAPKLDHPRQDRQTSDRADCNVTVPSTGAPNGCCRTPATKVLAAAARGDRGSTFGRIQLPKLAIESGEDLIDDAADQPQRMALRHSLFEVDIGKQFTRP